MVCVQYPYFYNQAVEVQFILNQPIDITELTELRAELEVNQQQAGKSGYLYLLHNERKRFNGLFKQAPGFMCILSGPDFIYDMANAAHYQLIGRDDIIGRSIYEVMPELADQCFIDFLKEVYTSG